MKPYIVIVIIPFMLSCSNIYERKALNKDDAPQAQLLAELKKAHTFTSDTFSYSEKSYPITELDSSLSSYLLKTINEKGRFGPSHLYKIIGLVGKKQVQNRDCLLIKVEHAMVDGSAYSMFLLVLSNQGDIANVISLCHHEYVAECEAKTKSYLMGKTMLAKEYVDDCYVSYDDGTDGSRIDSSYETFDLSNL